MSFTDEDTKNLKGFLEFVSEKAEFRLDWAEALQLAKYRHYCHELIKKVHSHVMELKRVEEARPEEPAPEPKKPKRGRPKKAE